MIKSKLLCYVASGMLAFMAAGAGAQMTYSRTSSSTAAPTATNTTVPDTNTVEGDDTSAALIAATIAAAQEEPCIFSLNETIDTQEPNRFNLLEETLDGAWLHMSLISSAYADTAPAKCKKKECVPNALTVVWTDKDGKETDSGTSENDGGKLYFCCQYFDKSGAKIDKPVCSKPMEYVVPGDDARATARCNTACRQRNAWIKEQDDMELIE